MLLPGGPVEMQILTQKVWKRTQDSAFLTNDQMTSMLLVHGPHVKYQGSRGNENNVRKAFDLRKHTFFENG